MTDVFGKALSDYHKKIFKPPLLLHNTYGEPEWIPIEGYFYDSDDFSEIEDYALEISRGRILDVGAAAGRHSLHLQKSGYNITSLEISVFCSQLMQERGLDKVITSDIFHYSDTPFDTILMLMNGAGIAGTIQGFRSLLSHFKKLMKKNGQLLIDSTDISYLFEPGEFLTRKDKNYFGELRFCYEYDGQKSDWFDWLYIDKQKLISIAAECGYHAQILYENEEDDSYLARLTFYQGGK